jgi:hypothetical protein
MKKNALLLLLMTLFMACSYFTPMKQLTDKILNQEAIEAQDLDEIEKDDLRILRNTIFAQYGYPFESDDLRGYFYEDQPFGYSFTREESYSNDSLTGVDKQNINTILLAENKDVDESVEVKNENDALNDLTSTQVFYLIHEDKINFYPELRSKFNTELKRKYFQESDEYAEYTPHFQALREEVKGHYFTKDISHIVRLGDYDLNAGGFFFLKGKDDWALGNEGVLHLRTTSLATSIDGFYSNDEISNSNSGFNYDYKSYTPLFISCSERNGLSIEKNKERIKFLLSFNVDFEDDNLKKGDLNFYIKAKRFVKIKNVKYQILLDGEVLAEKRIE